MNIQQTLRVALKNLTQSKVRILDFNRIFQDEGVEGRLIGELDLPTGRLVACDPALAEENPFEVALPPGRYPVILSVADLKGDKRVACARVQVKAGLPVTWKPALRGGDKPNSHPGYGVDSATGSFMDEQSAVIWRRQAENTEFFNAVTDQMDDGHSPSCCWGNISLDTAHGQVTAVIFSTGYGDGFYRSYWGYTAEGEIACLLTDFDVLKPSGE